MNRDIPKLIKEVLQFQQIFTLFQFPGKNFALSIRLSIWNRVTFCRVLLNCFVKFVKFYSVWIVWIKLCPLCLYFCSNIAVRKSQCFHILPTTFIPRKVGPSRKKLGPLKAHPPKIFAFAPLYQLAHLMFHNTSIGYPYPGFFHNKQYLHYHTAHILTIC